MVDSNQEKVDVEIGCEKCCPRYKNSPRDEKAVRLLQNRLNRMIGQLNGIKNMVEGNRYCGDITWKPALWKKSGRGTRKLWKKRWI